MSNKLIKTTLAIVFLATPLLAYAAGADFHLDKDINIKGKTYTSPVITFNDPMDRAVVSWNVSTPNGSFIKIELRAQGEDKKWSNWFMMGTWGKEYESYSKSGQKTKYGKVDIDTLILNNPAKNWQYKITLHNGRDNAKPIISAIALTVKNSKTYQKRDDLKFSAKPLNVPKISQYEAAKLAGDSDRGNIICSPTSTTMLLQFNGVKDISPLTIADYVLDNNSDIHYGNWPFNTAIIHDVTGHVSYVRWYESFGDLVKIISKGEPAIVSIGFKEGELNGAFKPVPGHLVLIRGADKKYVYVNDPAAPDKNSVARRYSRDQFVKAWKGVAYILDAENN